jgi:DNA-directed RNA polymerase specialized sigma24 family protein
VSRARRLWLFDPAQRWRLRYRPLWRGPSFDPNDLEQTYTYALVRLSRMERAVFLLCRFRGMGYSDIGRQLGISTSRVERCLAGAMYRLSLILDLVEDARARGVLPRSPSDAEEAEPGQPGE